MDASDLSRLLDACNQGAAHVQQRLSDLVRIPSVSFSGFEPAEVRRSAQATAQWFREIGMPEVRVGMEETGHPFVLARDHRAGTGVPTILLYAHHDVQPPLRLDVWTTPPFEPTVRNGRLYGRGTADDKAGIAVHAGSIAAWYATVGHLPVNVTVLIEGEEECGSSHLGEILAAHREELSADLVVIADLSNHDTGLPSLTTSLRGIAALEVVLTGASHPLHSGVWGGTVPDPGKEISRLLASLFDAQGKPAVAGLFDGVKVVSEARRQELSRIPLDLERFRAQAGLDPKAPLPPKEELLADLWLRPSLVVNAVQCGVEGQTGNVLMDRAWARLSLRTVAGMDPARCLDLLEAHLRARLPAGLSLAVHRDGFAPAWSCRDDLPVLSVARKALSIGYGREAVTIGCGASIPFVESMTAALGGVPALLVGVEDPWCNAHAENESVDLADLTKAVRSQAALFGLMSHC